MSHNLCPALPADRRQESFVIRWWEATTSDESSFCRAEFPNLAEAEEVLSWITDNPTSDGVCCSWLDPEAFAALESLPF